jgi:protocatechuate 3,4-dioxygenase beta subunit
MFRRFALLILLLGSGVSFASQAQELIYAPYLAPQYTAPPNAPSSAVIAGKDEPGERLIVTGRALDGTRPVAGVSIYAFHADLQGRYAPGLNSPDGELNPRLHGALRTDKQGGYRYETVRPGSYHNNPAHVHYVVIAHGYKPRMLELRFADDPILAARREAGEQDVQPGILNGPVCRSLPDCVVISPVIRDAQGVWHASRDIQMIRR